MIGTMRRLIGDRRGSAAVQFALIAPVFLVFVFGALEFGTLYYANAGIRQGVEVGARYATIYPRPTDTAITTKLRSASYGVKRSSITVPAFVRPTSNPNNKVTISASYQYAMNLPWVFNRTFTLTYSRTVYQAPT